ncbi:MAG: hypothetical protein H6551_13605 [Chitinophagales bacterium]|nr:hypothetical protein [Chitinophagaceae bacterium]MCB9066170.1 hypothetical protein [Chitinophagales bacterium]
MQRLLVFILTLLPVSLLAQPKISVGLSGGFNSSFSKINYTQNIAGGTGFAGDDAKFKGMNIAINVAVDVSILQVGAGVEIGSLKGDMIRQTVDTNYAYASNNPLVLSQAPRFGYRATDEKIAAPYITPNMFVNLKRDLAADLITLYGGAMFGYMLSSNNINYGGKGNGIMAGANLGLMVNITNKISVGVHEELRIASVGSKKDLSIGYNINTDRVVNYSFYYIAIDRYTLSFLSTNVGFRFKL